MNNKDIAIIWISCKFPWANNLNEFWENIKEWKESISFFWTQYDKLLEKSEKIIGAFGQIDEIDKFDAWFFGFSESEAILIDPQQRLFLEHAHKAFEDAWYSYKNLKSSVWVFWWCWMSTYLINNILPEANYSENWISFLESIDTFQMMAWNDKDYLCTRTSYKLNLKWPSMTIQSACSTSLLAVHQAIQSINSWECDLAIAWGVTIITPQTKWYDYQEDMIFSKDGHCKAFSDEATGTVFANWIWVILIKKLEDAVRDKDNIYAIIKWSWVVNDGWLRAGFSAPTVVWQENAIRRALNSSQIDMKKIWYIECHGTATKLWDMIEFEALKKCFKDKTIHSCALWSVKSNIWHSAWASGIAWLIKTAMCVKNNIIPKQIYTENSHINNMQSPFYCPQQTSIWNKNLDRRYAGISSFWLWWTNVHMIICSHEDLNEKTNQLNINLLPLSARNKKDLNVLIDEYKKVLLSDNNEKNVSNICYTTTLWREHHKERCFMIWKTNQEILENVYSINKDIWTWNNKKVFMYTWYGCQYEKMWAELYDNFELFREKIDEIHDICKRTIWISLKDILICDDKENKLGRMDIAGIAIVAMEIWITHLYMKIWVKPDILIGHSLWEYTAAHISWILSLEDLIKIVFERGRLLQSIEDKGAMMSAFTDIETIQLILNTLSAKKIWIAAINDFNNIVVSWSVIEIEKFSKICKLRNIQTKMLPILRPGHSPLVEWIMNEFQNILEQIEYLPSKIPIISSLTASELEQGAINPKYWSRHLRECVNYVWTIEKLRNIKVDTYIEIWPKPILSSITENCLWTCKSNVLSSIEDISKPVESIIKNIWLLYNIGYSIDWESYYKELQFKWRRVNNLPWYPLSKKSIWFWKKLPLKSDTKKISFSDSFYNVKWNKEILKESQSEDIENWDCMIFIDENDKTIDFLRKKIQGYNIYPKFIKRWNNFKNNSDSLYIINSSDKKQYEHLFNGSKIISSVIFFWWTEMDNKKEFNENSINYIQELLYCIQSLLSKLEQSINGDCRITIITKNTKKILSWDKASWIWQSAAYWLERVLALEFPYLMIRIIDIDEINNTTLENTIKESFSNEKARQIWIRNWKRYIARINKVSDIENKNIILDKDTQYIITWWAGWLWIESTKLLIELWITNIYLIWRKKEPSNEVIKIIEDNSKNCHIKYKQCDIWNNKEAKILFDEIKKNGRIWGIIHTAWVVKDWTFINQELDDIKVSFIPKVTWAWNIKENIENLDYDIGFLILFSSATSFIWNAWQINHAIANAYLDSLCYLLNWVGINTTTINWWAWKDIWILKDKKRILDKLEDFWIIPFETELGIKALKKIIINDYSGQIWFIPSDWEKISNLFTKENNFFISELISKKVKVSTPAKYINDLYIDNLIKKTIKKILQSDIEYEENFFNAWMDSLSSIQFRNILQRELWCSLQCNIAYQYPSIKSLSTYIKDNETKKINTNVKEVIQESCKININQISLSKQQERRIHLIDWWYWKLLVPIAIHVSFNKEALYFAIRQILKSNVILRSKITKNGIEIIEDKDLDWLFSPIIYDISDKNTKEKSEFLNSRKKYIYENPPNYNIEPSWTIECILLEDGLFIILLFLQHLEFDGTWVSQFVNLIQENYEKYLKFWIAAANEITDNNDYIKFIEWQKDYINSKIIEEDRKYFQKTYSNIKTIPCLPWITQLEHKSFPSMCYTPKQIEWLWNKLQKIWLKDSVSVFSIMTIAYAKLLWEIMETQSVVFGTVVHWRPNSEFNDTIWPFVTHFPIHVELDKHDTKKNTKYIHDFITNLNSRCAYPVSDLIENVEAFKYHPVHTYFADAFIMMNNYPKEQKNMSFNIETIECLWPIIDKKINWLETDVLNEMVWLFLVIDFYEWEIRCNFWYHIHRFSEKIIKWWAKRYFEILTEITDKYK